MKGTEKRCPANPGGLAQPCQPTQVFRSVMYLDVSYHLLKFNLLYVFSFTFLVSAFIQIDSKCSLDQRRV